MPSDTEASRPGRLPALIHRVEDGLLALLLAAMILLAIWQIVLRNLFDTGISWGDPLLRVMVLWLGLLGALAATRNNRHIAIDVLSAFTPKPVMDVVRLVLFVFAAGICAIIAWAATSMVSADYRDNVIIFADVPAWFFELIIPLAFGLMALRYGVLLYSQLAQLVAHKRSS
ncbi:MAG: hypothetical protein A2V90_07230 [Gammaproteobacteria bacterium RBG_16_57_12]|nr:MAG: hypothetical protein A2V90_07230 [Gammaproteobacteria bacterium RBG_16_57_12]